MLFINYLLSRRISDLNFRLKKEKHRMRDERLRLEEMLDESRAISHNLKEMSEREKQMEARLNNLSQEEASMSEQLSSAMEEVFARTEGVRNGIQNQNEKAGVNDESLKELQRTRETVREAMNHTMSFFTDIQNGFVVFRNNLQELIKRMQSIRDAGNVIQDVVKMIRNVTEKESLHSLSRLAQMAVLHSKNNDEILELSEAVLAEAERLNRTMNRQSFVESAL